MIEVGEYIRTEFGIARVKKITIEPECDIGIGVMPEVTALWINDHEYYEADDLLKHSKNIIDLIKVGDYVNGSKVINIENRYLYIDKTNPSTELCETLVDYQIKEILTHEQYENSSYKVGVENE